MPDEEPAVAVNGLTDGQRRAREFVLASRALEQAKERYRDAFLDLRLSHLDDEACALVNQALTDLGLAPVGDYIVVMDRHHRLCL